MLRTLQNNRDLKQAALNIEAARAAYRIDRADLLPSIAANGGATITGTSDDVSSTGDGRVTRIYNANMGTSAYELDLFGKIRSNNKAALNAFFATQEAQNVVRNSLIAETANAYLQYLADKKLLALTEDTLKAEKKTYDITAQSLKYGVGTQLAVAQAQTAVETAQVNLQKYKRAVAQDRNALVLLLGVKDDQAAIPEDATLASIQFDTDVTAGLPSDVLLARPDIRQAEYTLKARNADIGAARAAFFPSISLTGDYGFASTSLADLFTGGAAGAWSFVPQITLPIFEAGRNKANLDLAHIQKDKAMLSYEQAIRTGFREVSDSLIARKTLDEQMKAQGRLVKAAQNVYDLSMARYKEGVDDFLSVLDAQRSLYSSQQSAVMTTLEEKQNLVTFYKVLGGGSAEVRPHGNAAKAGVSTPVMEEGGQAEKAAPVDKAGKTGQADKADKADEGDKTPDGHKAKTAPQELKPSDE